MLSTLKTAADFASLALIMVLPASVITLLGCCLWLAARS